MLAVVLTPPRLAATRRARSWTGPVPAAAIHGPVRRLFSPSALYTGLLTPVFLWVLRRFRKIFAFQGSYRRGYR